VDDPGRHHQAEAAGEQWRLQGAEHRRIELRKLDERILHAAHERPSDRPDALQVANCYMGARPHHSGGRRQETTSARRDNAVITSAPAAWPDLGRKGSSGPWPRAQAAATSRTLPGQGDHDRVVERPFPRAHTEPGLKTRGAAISSPFRSGQRFRACSRLRAADLDRTPRHTPSRTGLRPTVYLAPRPRCAHGPRLQSVVEPAYRVRRAAHEVDGPRR